MNDPFLVAGLTRVQPARCETQELKGDSSELLRVQLRTKKGVRTLFPQRPGGCFAEKGPDTFFRRRGLTLLETILAIGLSVVVMALLGMAIDLNLRQLDRRRNQVEQGQLARAVLQRIADDLRGTIRFETVDFSGVGELAGGLPDTGELDPSALGDDGTGDDPADAESDEPQSVADSIAPPTMPGLYGTRYELEIDVSHLPRVDEYRYVAIDDDAPPRVMSDIKTVAYYVADPSGSPASGSTVGVAGSQESLGLVRREVDRAVARWAAESGGLASLDARAELLAPEVVSLELRYYNGEEWFDTWDSDEEGGLPFAVAVALAVAPSEAARSGDAAQGRLDTDPADDDLQVFRLVVALPLAEPIDEEALQQEATETEQDESPEDETPDPSPPQQPGGR